MLEDILRTFIYSCVLKNGDLMFSGVMNGTNLNLIVKNQLRAVIFNSSEAVGLLSFPAQNCYKYIHPRAENYTKTFCLNEVSHSNVMTYCTLIVFLTELVHWYIST